MPWPPHARTDGRHSSRQTMHGQTTKRGRQTTTTPRPQTDGHADGHATCTARHDHMHGHAHVTQREHRHERHRHMHMTARTRANTTRHATRQHTPPHGRGYPRIKNRAAGPLVLTPNASRTIFELLVTHEIFTRIGHATVVAPVGVSRIHLG